MKKRACIHYAAANPYVDKVVVGVENFLQFKEVVELVVDHKSITSSYPEISCSDELLIDPSNWSGL